MKQILFLMLLASCSTKRDSKNKYILFIESSTHSILTNREEIETKIDSFYAQNAVSAFDSAALEIYGMQVADSVVFDALHRNKRQVDYKYYKRKIREVKILDNIGNDISAKIPDSIKRRIFIKYGIRTLNN